ncbi:MAG: hypothetical protein GQF41_1338 [Candidatus Rifleibacterium amylolyticum]|nr:MAG: hypothetical protein GQF41_1338 [Candidatus Rifleibacterium amylolyticum]
MTRKFSRFLLSMVVLSFIIATTGSASAFDFAQVKKDVKEALEKGKGEIRLADLGYLKFLPAGQIVLKEAVYHEPEKNPHMIVLAGRGNLPVEFSKLAGKDSDIVLTFSADAATAKTAKDMVCSVNSFFDAAGLSDFYGKMDDNIFKELLGGKCMFSHSNFRQTLTADLFPDNMKKKFISVLGEGFSLVLKDGVTLSSEINFNPKHTGFKAVNKFAKLLGWDRAGLIASAFLSPDWKHITIKTVLDDGFKMGFLPDNFGVARPYFFCNLAEIGVGFELSFKMHDDMLQGVCQISLPVLLGKTSAAEAKPAADDKAAAAINQAAVTSAEAFAGNDLNKVKSGSAVLLAAMNGVWHNAFSIKNFDIGDLVLKGELPTSSGNLVLGFGGRVDIGKIQVAVGGKVPLGFDLTKVAFMGKASRIPFGELIAMIIKSAEESKKDSDLPVDKLALKDVIVSIAAKDDRDLNIKEGLTFAGELEFDGKVLGKIDVRTTHPEQSGVMKPLVGFRALGWLKNFDLGPLKVTGNGADGKAKTKDDGVYLDMAYGTKLTDHLKFSGLIKLFSAEKEAQISITRISIDVFMRDKVFDLYEAEITMKGSANPKKPDFLLKAALTENFADDAVKYTTEFMNDAVEEMTDSLADAQEDFENAQEALEDARKDAARGLDDFKKDVEKIAAKAEKAQKKVDRLEKSLDKKEKQLKKLKWNKFKKRAKLTAQIAGLKVSIPVAKTALKAVKSLMSEKNIDKAAEGLKKVADEALKLAENSMKEASEKFAEAKELADKANVLAGKMKDFGKNFKIDEAGFEMALDQIKKNKSPELYYKAEIFGKKVNGKAQFDFTNQKEAFMVLAKAMFEKFAEQEKELGQAALLLLESL